MRADLGTTFKKDKAMVAETWGDSDSDGEPEEQKTKCLVTDDQVSKTHFIQAIMMKTLSELKEVIDDQKETSELQRCEIMVNSQVIDDFIQERDKVLEEIEYLWEAAFTNRDLANTNEENANLFLAELKVLRTDKLFLSYKVETLSKSLEESQFENKSLTEQVMTLSSHDT